MNNSNEVLYEVKDRVATITINRPDKRNSINSGVRSGLHQYLDRASSDPNISAIILTGAGGNFCVGADLGGRGSSEDLSFLERHEGRGQFAKLLMKMNKCWKPILAAVEGNCLAGGIGICLSCDLVIAHEDARFGTPEIKRGLWPYMVTAVLIRNVGRKKALELCMTGEYITAIEAERIGMINYAVPKDEYAERVNQMAQNLSSFSPAIMGLGKASFYQIADMEVGDALSYLQCQLTLNSQCEDLREGIAAFFEKREPRWKGK